MNEDINREFRGSFRTGNMYLVVLSLQILLTSGGKTKEVSEDMEQV
jgi:hypothetical protein